MPQVGSPPPTLVADAAPAGAPRRRRRLWLTALAAVLALLALAAWRATADGPAPLTTADVDRAVQRGLEQAQEEQAATPPAAAVAYRTIGPSLVTVTTGGAAGESSLGAGTVINADGSVLTALHVVDGGGPVEVQFADGTRATARIAKEQADLDIAVLAVDRLPELVVPAVLGSPPPVGADVFAVGNPLGLQASLTAGVVSATDRAVSAGQGPTLRGLLQFDAAVNPGNSGGPLLNPAGQVVGVVTALANPSQQPYFIGIEFAVPITAAGGVAGGPQQ